MLYDHRAFEVPVTSNVLNHVAPPSGLTSTVTISPASMPLLAEPIEKAAKRNVILIEVYNDVFTLLLEVKVAVLFDTPRECVPSEKKGEVAGESPPAELPE